MKTLLTLILLFISFSIKAQDSNKQLIKIDSLKAVIANTPHDTILLKAYNEWDNLIYYQDPELDLKLNEKIVSICNKNRLRLKDKQEKKIYTKNLSRSLGNIGLIYQNQGNFKKALEYHLQSLALDEEIEDKKGMASSLYNIGQIYINLGNYEKAIAFHRRNVKINKELGNKQNTANSLNSLGFIFQIKNEYKQALDYFQQCLKLREAIKDKKGMAIAMNDIGILYNIQGAYARSLEYFSKSLKINKELGNKTDQANTLNNIGIIYKNQGKQAKAIDYYSSSLKIREEIGDKKGIATSLNNIGLIYHEQDDYKRALDYYKRCLKINKEIADKAGIATSLNNIGLMYSDKKQYDSASKYYEKSIKLKEEIGDKKGIATSLNNIGTLYNDQGKYKKSLDYQMRSLELREEIGDKKGIATSLNTIGIIYKNEKNYTRAIDFGKKSLRIAQDIGAASESSEAAKNLFEIYKIVHQSTKALQMHELYIELRDSINSEANRKEVIRQEYKYQYEKQAVADSIKNEELQKVKDAQLAVQKAENKQEKLKSYFLYFGLFLTLLFGGFIFNRFRKTSQQKSIIEKQKKQVDVAFVELGVKNKEILDSINYAKRIQTAILPPDKIIKKSLPNSFILYKPKAIVAGDFYWFERKDDLSLIAAADCTGHGVPGAMVSVVCNNSLNRSVREYKLENPGQILDKTRELVIQEFEKSEGDVRDGMDIALCTIKGLELHYAGAYNPLWIIRNGELVETKANKQPIGKYDHATTFSSHQIQLENNDTIYLFSDGYADQFGGAKGKKLKAKAFRELLLSIQDLSMSSQKEYLDSFFEKWRGDLEQIDDVCVIGIRV